MTLRSIQWIADSGLLVGLTTIGEFSSPTPVLAQLSLSNAQFTLGAPSSGLILGLTAGSVISASGLPAGLAVTPAGWTYDGSGVAGTFGIVLTETLIGGVNSPNASTITVSITTAGTTLDFSQSGNSGEIAVIRSF